MAWRSHSVRKKYTFFSSGSSDQVYRPMGKYLMTTLPKVMNVRNLSQPEAAPKESQAQKKSATHEAGFD